MNLKMRELIISVIMIGMFLVFGLTVVSNASSITYNWTDSNNSNSGSIINQISLTNTNTNTNTNENVSTVNTNTNISNVSSNTNNSTSMPDTGLEDLPWVIIAICGISAIFAYRKIKEYNID